MAEGRGLFRSSGESAIIPGSGGVMQAEVLAVGSELLLGQIVDTNSAVIARHLAAIGLDLYYKTTVGDNLSRVAAALCQALGRSQVVLTTGGIGPTADDITREAVAAATDRELVFSDQDRKSTRLNSSHVSISYAVFCLKKKK